MKDRTSPRNPAPEVAPIPMPGRLAVNYYDSLLKTQRTGPLAEQAPGSHVTATGTITGDRAAAAVRGPCDGRGPGRGGSRAGACGDRRPQRRDRPDRAVAGRRDRRGCRGRAVSADWAQAAAQQAQDELAQQRIDEAQAAAAAAEDAAQRAEQIRNGGAR
jgi:hypothetical protein